VKLWQQFDLNETNVVENGFYNEFKLAQSNLLANIAAGRGNTFRYFGAGTNTSPLPHHPGKLRGECGSRERSELHLDQLHQRNVCESPGGQQPRDR
jgi:hypothetical protein